LAIIKPNLPNLFLAFFCAMPYISGSLVERDFPVVIFSLIIFLAESIFFEKEFKINKTDAKK